MGTGSSTPPPSPDEAIGGETPVKQQSMALTDPEDLQPRTPGRSRTDSQQLRAELSLLKRRFDDFDSSIATHVVRVMQEIQSGVSHVACDSALPNAQIAGSGSMLPVQPSVVGKRDGGDASNSVYGKHIIVPTHEEELTLKDLYAKQMEQNHLDLEESVYDSALLAIIDMDHPSRPQLLLFEKFMALSVYFLNMAVQAVLVWAVVTTLGHTPYPEEKQTAILNQRLSVGQDIRNYNLQDKATMTQQYCKSSYLSYLSSTGGHLSDYLLKDDSSLPGVPGRLICFLAMFIWVVTMTQEFRRIANTMLATLSLRVPSGTTLRRQSLVGADDGHSMVFTTLSRAGKVATTCLIFLPRLTLASSLFFFGLRYLAHTVLVEDLILNAGALLIVKDIDEILYVSLLTRHIHARVMSTEIRPPPPTGCFHRLMALEPGIVSRIAQGWALVRVAVIAACLAAAYVLFLANALDEMNAAYDNLCSDNITFAFADTPNSGLPLFAEPSSEPKECVAAAREDMIRMAAGVKPKYIDNQTLISIGQGWHPKCVSASVNCTEVKDLVESGCPSDVSDRGWFTCPITSWTLLQQVRDNTATDFLDGRQCRDQQGSFMILRAVCLHDDFTSKEAWLRSFFEYRTTCAEAMDVCSIASDSEYPPPWGQVIEGVCPMACGLCSHGGGNEQRNDPGGGHPQQEQQGSTNGPGSVSGDVAGVSASASPASANTGTAGAQDNGPSTGSAGAGSDDAQGKGGSSGRGNQQGEDPGEAHPQQQQ